MANFNAATLTKKGIGLLAKAQAGQTAIEFTKAAAGDGSYGEGEALTEKESLKNQRQEFPFDKLSVVNGSTVSMKFTITNNQESGLLQEGYYVKEVGVFATDPDEGEVLYAIAAAVENQWDYMPAYSSLMPAYITVEFYAEVSNAAEVTIVCSGRFVTAEEAEAEHAAIREEAKTEHGEIRGLIMKLSESLNVLGLALNGALTEEDKGAANGVASLDGRGRVPYEQLPYESGAVYLGEKLGFDDFAWNSIQGYAGWVGTYANTQFGAAELIRGMMPSAGWAELLLIPDLNRLYSMYTESYADCLAGKFAGVHFKAFAKITGNLELSYKIFSESDLGSSEAAKVAFWPYLLRRDAPSY